MVKFIHTADWQLGMTRHFLAGEAQARFSGARIDAVRRIGSLAVEEGCEFVVVCGDVFESNQVERQVVVRALDAMAVTPDVAFYLLPGNHDPLDAASVFRSPTFTEHRPANVVVLESSEPVVVAPAPVRSAAVPAGRAGDESGRPVAPLSATAHDGECPAAASGPPEEGPRVELVAAPWFSKRPLGDLVAEACDGLDPPAGGALRIAVGHGAVDVLTPDRDDPAVISLGGLEVSLGAGLIHYVALGDRHSTTDVGGTGRVRYSGAPEPTDYDEVDPGNVLVVEFDTGGVQVEPRRVGTWTFLRRNDVHLTGDADLDALEEWLSGLPGKERTIVKLGLVGQVSLTQKARLDAVLEHHADLLAALESWEQRSDLAVIPDEADVDDLGLSGFAREALGNLRELAESGEQVVAARDALALLHRFTGVGR